MTLTLRKIVAAYETAKLKPLPTSMSNEVAFRIGLIGDKLEIEFNRYKKETEKLREKYGESKTEGGPRVVDMKGKNYPSFAKEHEDILDMEIPDVHAYTIKLSLLCPKEKEEETEEEKRDRKGLAQVIQGIFPFIIDDLHLEDDVPKDPKKKAETKAV
jgi:hypothetical protein